MHNGRSMASQAYWMLRTEFTNALAEGPSIPVSTPATEGHDERPVVDVVCDLLAQEEPEDGHELLTSVLAALQTSSFTDHTAEKAVQLLAHRFAVEQTKQLALLGALDEETQE